MSDEQQSPVKNGHANANGNGYVTVAIAAIVLKGKRTTLRRAQWLKIYECEEDKFYAVRPFLLQVKSSELAERISERITDMVEKLKADGFAYIGDISFEQNP